MRENKLKGSVLFIALADYYGHGITGFIYGDNSKQAGRHAVS